MVWRERRYFSEVIFEDVIFKALTKVEFVSVYFFVFFLFVWISVCFTVWLLFREMRLFFRERVFAVRVYLGRVGCVSGVVLV